MNRILFLVFVLCTSLFMHFGAQSANAESIVAIIPSMHFVDRGVVKELPLNSYKADVDIVGNIANVKLTQTFINVAGRKIDAKYRFPGSTQAAVNGMTMKIKDRVIYAQIQEKQEARQTYEKAKEEGKRASLLSQEKPNIFTTEVANIYAGDTIQVVVEYSEIIEYKEYVYSFVLPTKIGERYQNSYEKVGERGEYDVYSNTSANKKIDFEINVSISSIFDVSKVRCKTHDISAEQKDGKTYVIMNTPTALDRDFILQYEMVSKKVESGLLLHEGEDENFFLLMLQAPRRVPAEEILPREYVFVVDVSGSMNGKPIETAIHLFGNLLEKTNEEDMFNVVKFAGSNETLFDEARPATMENLQKGFDFLSNERGGGGTELLTALKRAMELPKQDKYSRSVILITDGFISADLEVIEYLSENLDKGNVFPFGIGNSVNRYLIEGLANISMSEPFIITDMKDANKEADKFKEYIEAPVMTDIKIEYEGFDAYDIVPEKIPDVFAQRPIIISGKYKGHPSGIVRVSGQNGKQEMKTYFQVENFAQMDTSQVLKYLWARRKLQTLQDFPGPYSYRNSDENKQAIIDLGLKYHLMTNHTSFVAVDTEEGEAEQIEDQAINKMSQSKTKLSGKTITANRARVAAMAKAPNENIADAISMTAGVQQSGSGFSTRGTRQADTQILVEGMDMSKKYTGGMGIGGSKYYPNGSNINTGYGNVVVGDLKGNFLEKIDLGSRGTIIQSYPIKDGKLDESFKAGDTVRLDIEDLKYQNASSVIDDLKPIEEVFSKHIGLSPFTWKNYNFEFLVDKNDNLCLIELPVGNFTEVKDMQEFIKEIIEVVAEELDNPLSNTIYGASIKVNPSGKFTIDGTNYETEFVDTYFWRETKEVEMIEDGSKYNLYFEIWDDNGELLVKGVMDDLINDTNPFISGVRGNIKIPKNEYCMHYLQLEQDNLQLGDVMLKGYEKYYVNLKGVIAEAGR